jgi:hypothetical protein
MRLSIKPIALEPDQNQLPREFSKQKLAENSRNSLYFFPVRGEFDVETGSLRTPSTTIKPQCWFDLGLFLVHNPSLPRKVGLRPSKDTERVLCLRDSGGNQPHSLTGYTPFRIVGTDRPIRTFRTTDSGQLPCRSERTEAVSRAGKVTRARKIGMMSVIGACTDNANRPRRTF